MPQLRGYEQQELHALLVDHIGFVELARVLSFQGLPELDELAGKGNLRDQTEEVIDALSRRYQIITLVEGAINELDGSCPPLEAWFNRHSQELKRRKLNPTWSERIGEASSRIAIVPIAISGGILLAAIVVLFVPTLLEEDSTVCRIYDSATNQRILRPFTIAYGDVRRESVGTQCEIPLDLVDSIDRVSAVGYIQRAPDKYIKETDSDKTLVKLFLTRDHSNNNYLNSILPDFSSVAGLPSNEVILAQVAKNTESANDVTFLVQNETDYAIDVLLYYMPPAKHEDATNLFLARTQLIDQIDPRGWSDPFDKFRLTAGFFAIFVSHSGKNARLVTSSSLYQAPWVVLVVSRVEDTPVGRLEFYSSDPRDK